MATVRLVHVPKTAGTSIKNCMRKNRLGKIPRGHKKIVQLKTQPDDFIFAVTRNPYDRAISLFYHFYKEHGLFTDLYKDYSVNDFYHEVLSNLEGNKNVFARDKWKHWKTQSNFILHRKRQIIAPKISRILKFENLNEDWAQMVADLKNRFPNWEKAPEVLPHANQSPRPKKSWDEVLDDKSIDAINIFFEKDFRILDYEKV